MSGARIESVLVSLGSNIEPELHLLRATEMLACRVRVLATSRVFESLPVGAGDAPSFLNAALEIRCEESPAKLKLEVLRPLEKRLGRIRTADRNAPRTIDLDISLYGQRIVNDRETGLEIPDPEILERAHVALPLADVAPQWIHPVTGERLAEIAARFPIGQDIRIREGLELSPGSHRL